MSVIFLIIGFLASSFLVLAPVHEIGHIMFAGIVGRQAEFIGWASVRLLGGYPVGAAYFYGGAYFECFVSAWMGLANRKWVRWFGIGWLLSAILFNAISEDFIDAGLYAYYWTPDRAGTSRMIFIVLWSLIASLVLLRGVKLDRRK